MTDRLPDRWTNRDLPVLVAVARRLDERPGSEIDANGVRRDLPDLSWEDANAALAALQGTYIDGGAEGSVGDQPDYYSAKQLTERGRRAVGLWPAGESVDALIDALEQAAELSDDTDEAGWLRRLAREIGKGSREVMTEVLGAVVAKTITG